MSKGETARAIFRQGFNCSQAVLAAFSEEFGLDAATAYRVAAGFGGGMGRMGETCGAVTGAFMVIGLKYGMAAADGCHSNREAIGQVREAARKFKELHGSIKCSEILGVDINDSEAFRQAMKDGIPARICPALVQDAADIAAGLTGIQNKQEVSHEGPDCVCQSKS